MAEKQADEVLVDVDGRTLKISNLGKVMYPTTGTTKGEVLNYYARVAPVLLPHLADRAVTRIRWPHGTGDMQFFEKNLPSGAPSWLHSVTVPSTGSRGGGDTISYPVIDGLADLTYFANLASLELHVHQWTVGDERPAEEPQPDGHRPRPRAPRRACRSAARWRCWCATSSRSAACPRRRSPRAARACTCTPRCPASSTPTRCATRPRRSPRSSPRSTRGLVVWKMTKSLRGGKVFLDWSQNTGAKTTISPYSLRGRDRPYVAAPRTWEEIEDGAEEGLGQLEMDDVLARVDEDGDIFGDLLGGR